MKNIFVCGVQSLGKFLKRRAGLRRPTVSGLNHDRKCAWILGLCVKFQSDLGGGEWYTPYVFDSVSIQCDEENKYSWKLQQKFSKIFDKFMCFAWNTQIFNQNIMVNTMKIINIVKKIINFDFFLKKFSPDPLKSLTPLTPLTISPLTTLTPLLLFLTPDHLSHPSLFVMNHTLPLWMTHLCTLLTITPWMNYPKT